ncbi:pentatricopeptide repeat-containing protein At5g56310-like isoform X2 [Oryza brachyantha]|uniref:pentatricopeptide repeat-containing protein At5g56310-like isoform X2 n=1 Tax=Oryza brachyantha TaxID=4533 RepID=UPI001ADA29B0|nr:pentatricopeptide repeat-containing protein At5g56310-like isoform X2 [Oryza brachyantha]
MPSAGHGHRRRPPRRHPPGLPPHTPYSRALQQRLYLLAQHRRRRIAPGDTSSARRALDQLHAQVILNGFPRKRFLLAKLLSLAAAAADLPRAESLFLAPAPAAEADDSCSSASSSSTTLANLLLRAAASSRAPPHRLVVLFSRLVSRHGFRPNAFSFSTILAALVDAGAAALPHGRALHARAVACGLALSSGHVLTSLLDLYAVAGQLREARQVFDEMPERTVAAWNCMLAAYVRCREMDVALWFFNEMPERDSVAWTTMIAGCANAGRAAEAVELFWRMRKANVKDDAVTMVALLTACAEQGDLRLGRWVHTRVEQEGREWRTVLLDNALINMYVKCGAMEDAHRLFLVMPKRSTVSWTTMISGLAIHGRAEEALDLFHRMQEHPDGATLLAVLLACSHAGRVDDGRQYFQSMERFYGITPGIQHYGCMVDMLCRRKQLREALELVKTMPLQPNDAVWGALLSGCKREGNLEIAAEVTERLIELQPERAAGHLVLLANMYAGVGQWEQAGKLRERIATLDAGKSAGTSKEFRGVFD